MILNLQDFFLLCMILLVGIILIIVFTYCFMQTQVFTDTRRRLIHWQLTRDEETAINRGQSQETISLNQQIRNDIRHKYQLK